MANRFDKTYDQPWVSQYVPLPLKEIEAGYEKQQGRYDKAMELVTDLSTPITGGNRTKDQAADINAKKDAAIKAAVDKAAANNDYSKLQYEVKSIANQIKSNPIYQGIELDKQLSPLADKAIMEPNAQNHVQDYFDQDKKTYNQKPLDQPFTANDYQTIKPVDFYEDHKDLYTALHAQSVKEGGPVSGLKYEYNQNGELVGVNENHQQIRKGIAPEDVAAFAERWTSNPDNWKGRGSVVYRDALSKKKFGVGYDQSDYIQDMVNNYPGYYAETSDVTTQSNIPVKGAGKVAGVTKTPSDGPNRLVHHLNIMDQNPNGSTTANAADFKAFHNGVINPDGSVSITPDPERTAIQIGAAATNSASAEDQLKINKAIQHKDKYAQEEEDNKEIAKTVPTSLDAAIGGKLTKGRYYYGNFTGKDRMAGIAPQYFEYDSETGKTRELTEDQYEQTGHYKGTLVGLNQNDPKIARIKRDALKDGIDMDDSKYMSKIDGLTKDQVYIDATVKIKDLAGRVGVFPGSGENTFEDSNGDIITKGDIFVSESDLSQLFGDSHWYTTGGYKVLVDKGIIKQGRNDKDGKPTFVIPVYQKVQGDIGNITEAMQLNNYTDGAISEKVLGRLDSDRQEAIDVAQKHKSVKLERKFNQEYEKNPDKFKLNWALSLNDSLVDLRSIMESQGQPKEAIDGQIKIISDYKIKVQNLPESTPGEKAYKKSEMYKLNMLVNDPSRYDVIYPKQDDGGAGVGKQTPQQDNNNPLGM